MPSKNETFIADLFTAYFFMGIMACQMDKNVTPDNEKPGTNAPNPTESAGDRLIITIGTTTFKATLLDNPTVAAFKARFPLTLEMSELNGNEKLYRFPKDLPINSANAGTIRTGDLMIYDSNTLVLFYKSFPTIYSYTKLDRIDNTSGLAEVVGSGSVTVTFALE